MLRIADLVTWCCLTEDTKMQQHCGVNFRPWMSIFNVFHTVHFLIFRIFKKPTTQLQAFQEYECQCDNEDASCMHK
jgi:hypothetical protein